jgi:predicted MFS family arabinose efflux permease
MKISFRIIAKFALLLVIFGFFMPIACDMNGFKLAQFMTDNDKTFEGLLMYLLFISAAAGVVVGVLLLLRKSINVNVDWLIIGVCIASGLIVYFTQLKDGPDLQNGAYVIVAGWIIALVAQIYSGVKGE